MPHSPYLNLNRDLETLERIVRDHEAAKGKARRPVGGNRPDAKDVVWEPVYPMPVAMAARTRVSEGAGGRSV